MKRSARLLPLCLLVVGCLLGQTRTYTDNKTFELQTNTVVAAYGPSSQPIVKPGTLVYLQLRSLVPMESYTISICYTASATNTVRQSSVTLNTPPENDTVLWFPGVIWIEPGQILSLSVRPNAQPMTFQAN